MLRHVIFNMRRSIIILIFCVIVGESIAQSSNISTIFLSSFEKGEKMYQALAYRNALELYLYTVQRNPENILARQRIADCYFRLGNIEEAERRYAELANLEGSNPIYKYQYAQVLSIQGKYGDAERWFSAYASSQKDDPRAQHKIDFIYSISYYFRDSVLYNISNESYNSDQSDFAPHYYKDRVIFVSARDRDLFIKKKSLSAIDEHESHLNVFSAPLSSSTENEVIPFYNDDLNSVLHDGPITFFDKEKQIAFTRNNTRNGKPISNAKGRVNLKIFFAKLNENGKMSQLTEFPFNDNDYSVGHPWVSEDGNLMVFASDMPGGFGGVDLYKSTRVNAKWNKPVNLGSTVNTLGDEFYPFMAGDSALYFSSNGHGGLGGLDIFVSKANNGEFNFPVNLGFPLNTSGDDFSLILNASGREGHFASNRSGGKGYDDIYKFTVKSFFLTGKVVDRMDSITSLSGAEVNLFDIDNNKLGRAVSDKNGMVNFDLDFDAEYVLTAAKENYSWVDTLKYSTLTRYMGGDSVLIPLWKQSLFAKGTVYSNETQSVLSDATVQIECITDKTKNGITVDASGKYFFKLQPNKKYIISASKDGHIAKSFILNTANIYNGDLINDFLLEEIFIDKAVVQFDFDKSDLKSLAIEQLQPLLKSLNRRPESTLNIGAHADAFGTKQYNQRLSERRAQSVLAFFVNNGIPKSRITAVGFGEELLLNNCSQGTDCTEEENSLNRRAEIKVQIPE